MAVSRVYLDSYYLLEMVERMPERDVKKLMYTIKSNSFEIFVPQIVLGEVVAKLFTKHPQTRADLLSRLPEILLQHNIDLDVCLTPPLTGAAFEIMRSLHSADPRLGKTDIMILSHALVDPDSKFFFTPDSDLIGSSKVAEYERGMRSEGKRNVRLTISEGLHQTARL